MHILSVNDYLPHTYHGGGGITAYAAIKAMLAEGHKVTVLALFQSNLNGSKSAADHQNHLESLGANVVKLEAVQHYTKLDKMFSMRLSSIFSGAKLQAEVQKFALKTKPDFIFTYHWDALASVDGIKDIPKMGLVGDPVHLPQLFRAEIERRLGINNAGMICNLKKFFKKRLIQKQINAMVVLLNQCALPGAFAAHHAQLFRELGVKHCSYYRTPTPDPLLEVNQKNYMKDYKFRILHIGHLQGTATISGIEEMLYQTLPVLKRELGCENFEIHIVGGFYQTMPQSLRNIIEENPCIKIKGQVSPPHEEFLKAHVVLVPTSIELGIRVRIITAFSYGSCVVAHVANQAGIPELKHEENALLGKSGEELGQFCLRLAKNNILRRQIEDNARRLYEAKFSLEMAGIEIVKKLEQYILENENIK